MREAGAPLVPAADQGRGGARRLRPGTAGKLAAFHALVILTVLGIVVVQFTQAFANRYRTTITRDLAENLTSFSQGAAARPAGQSLAVFARGFLATHGDITGDLLLISLPGQHLTLGSPGSRELASVHQVAALLGHPPRTTALLRVEVGDTPQEVLATPIEQAGQPVGTFVTAGSLASYERTRAHVLELALGEGLITLLAAVVSIYVLLRRLLGSVRQLTRAARDIGLHGELDIRLGGEGTGDEVSEMAATFDAMIAQIDAAVAVQRRLLADVSHQLRTPLTVARGHLEVMCRGPLDDPAETRVTVDTVIDELDHLEHLVERLLLLGRSLEADFVQLQPVDLRALLLDVAEAARVLAPRRWSVGPIPDVVMLADLEKVRGALLNLVDNAVRATSPKDTIRLAARLNELAVGRQIDITVDDSGPGIPVHQRDAALGRFARPAARGTDGTGLGLAIVEAVARSHGGQASIGDSPLGGCRITLSLPLREPAPEPAGVTAGTVEEL